MRFGFLLLPLLTFVGAAESHNHHHGWKHGVKYQYEMRGRNVVGFHQVSNQFVGVLTRGILNVQPRQNNIVNFKLEAPEQMDFHRFMPRGWRTFLPDEGASYTNLPISRPSFDLEFQDGKVVKMWVPEEASNDDVNILKAIASLLQLDIARANLRSSEIDLANSYYQSMEESVHGEVETLYTLSPLPAYVFQSQPSLAPICKNKNSAMEVRKTLDFSKARHLPLYHYGFSHLPHKTKDLTNIANLISRSANGHTVICTDDDEFLIHSTVMTEKINVAPHLYNEQKGLVASQLNLTLINEKPSAEEPPSIANAVRELSSLQYFFNQPEITEPEPSSHLRSKRSTINKEKMKLNNLEEENAQVIRPKGRRHEGESDQNNKNGKFHHGSRASSLREQWKKESKMNIKNNKTESSSVSASSAGDSDSSASSLSIASNEDYWQPISSLILPPYNPFLPFFVGNRGNSIQSVTKIKDEDVVGKLSHNIAKNLQEPNLIGHEQTLYKFSTLVQFIQTMNADQIGHAAEQIYAQRATNSHIILPAWAVMRDAVAQAGTGPAFSAIRNWIKTGKVQREEAAELVASAAKMAHYPTEEYVDALFDLMKSEHVAQQMYLNCSTVISFADFARRVLVSNETMYKHYPVHSFGPPRSMKSKLLVEKYIPYLDTKLKEAIASGESKRIQLYTWALGTIAHPKVLSIFLPYLQGYQRISEFQRLTMVVSLNEMAKLYPKLIRPLMFKIYQNIEEKPEIRVAAIMQLMKTNPPIQVLQRIAEFSNYETSKQVNSAVKAAIESAARQLHSSETQELTRNANAAVDLLSTYQYGSQYSKIFLSSWDKRNVHLGYKHEMTHIQSESSVFPSSIFCSIQRYLGGFKVNPSENFISTSSVSNLIDLLSSLVSTNVAPETKDRSKVNGTQWTYEDIAKKLKIHSPVEDQVEGYVMTSLFGAKRLLTFDNHSIFNLPEHVRQIVNDVRAPKPVNVTKFFDQLKIKTAFPTATGLPFSFSFSVPTVISITGTIQGKVHPDPTRSNGQIHDPKTLNVTTNLNITYSALSHGKMSFITPFNQKEYSAGLKRQVHFHLPLHLDADFDLENKKLWWKLQPSSPESKIKLFEYSTIPYTSYGNIFDVLNPSGTEKVVHVQPLKKVNTNFGPASVGLAFDINMETEQQFLSWSNIYEAVRKHDFFTSLLYPFAEEAINFNNFKLTYDGPRSLANEVKGVIKYVRKEKEDSNNLQQPSYQSQQNSGKTKAYQGIDSGFDSKERESNLLMNVTSNISGASARLLDVSLQFSGSSFDKRIAAAVAVGSYRTCERSRVALFYSFGENSEKSQNFEVFAQVNAKSPLLHVINFKNTRKEDATINLDGQLTFGRNNEKKSVIDIDVKMKKSEGWQKAFETSPLTKVCEKQMEKGYWIQAACRNVTGLSGHMDQYRVNLRYNHIPSTLKKLSYISYTIGRYFASYHMDEALAQVKKGNDDGKIFAAWNFGHSLKTVNISMASPFVNAAFINVPVNPMLAKPISVIHPMYPVDSRVASQMTRNQYFPICAVEGSLVNTFDNLTYPSNFGNCWYVMAHHGRKSFSDAIYKIVPYNFTVLMRKTSNDGKELQMILNNNVIHLQPGKTGPSFLWNGYKALVTDKKVSKFWDDNKNEVAAAYILPGNVLAVESPHYGLQVLYDGSRIILQLANTHRAQVRGLCGNFNGEKIDDWMTPSNCVHSNPFSFASTYHIPETSCREPDYGKIHASKAQCVPIRTSNAVFEYTKT